MVRFKLFDPYVGPRLRLLMRNPAAIHAYAGTHPSDVNVDKENTDFRLLLVDLSCAAPGRDLDALREAFSRILESQAGELPHARVERFDENGQVAFWIEMLPGQFDTLLGNTLDLFDREVLPLAAGLEVSLRAEVLFADASPIEALYCLRKLHNACGVRKEHGELGLEVIRTLRLLAEVRLEFVRTMSTLMRASVLLRHTRAAEWSDTHDMPGFAELPIRILQVLDFSDVRGIVHQPVDEQIAHLARLMRQLYAEELDQLYAALRHMRRIEDTDAERREMLKRIVLEYFIEDEESIAGPRRIELF